MKLHRPGSFFIQSSLRSLILSCGFLVLLASPAAAQVADPLGDNDGQADVVELAANSWQDGQGARIRLRYAQPVQPPLVGYIFIDVDRNPATSVPSVSPLPGIDAVVKYQLTTAGGQLFIRVDIMTQSGTETVLPPKTTKVRFRIDGDLLVITLSRDFFGGISVFDFFVATDKGDVGDSEFDRIPDAGVIDYSTGITQVKVTRPGDNTINATLTDPVQDTVFPDLSALLVKVVDDRLQMVVSYNHSVTSNQAFPFGSRIEGRIYLDTDRRLATGFANGGESPPSLGADYAVQFTLQPRRPFEASLLSFHSRVPNRSAPNELKLGLAFFNDCIAKPSGNQVLFDLPLSLLGDSTGNVFVRVDSVARPANTLDAVPDDGSFAVAARRVRPPFACATSIVEVPDPTDSPQGNKNDELLNARACLSLNNDLNGDLLLLQIDYASLQPVLGSATTKIYLDVDQNPATGMAVSNANATIGADYILSYSINLSPLRPDPVISVQLLRVGSQPQVYNQLTSFTFGPMGFTTISVPLTLLGPDDGNMDMLVETSSGTSRLDVMPNNGVIRVRRP